jgi:hypothetical protein
MLLLEKSKYRHCGSVLTVASVHSGDLKPIPNFDNRRLHDKEADWMQRHNPDRSFPRPCGSPLIVESDRNNDERLFAARKVGPICKKNSSLCRRLLGLSLASTSHLLFIMLIALLVLTFVPSLALADKEEPRGGQVLPPGARPQGYSLEDMARLVGPFTINGNNPNSVPKTPFSILFTASGGPPAMSIPCQGGTGVLDTGCNTFLVKAGTEFFLALLVVDDSPPVLGEFPTDQRQAIPYFFGPKQYGGEDFYVAVDGRTTPLGPEFLAGPVQTPPLNDGGGTHLIELGAFLTPLSLGLHTIIIHGEIDGAGVLSTYGISCLEEIFSYFVEVVP